MVTENKIREYKRKVGQLKEAVKEGIDKLMEFRILNENYELAEKINALANYLKVEFTNKEFKRKMVCKKTKKK